MSTTPANEVTQLLEAASGGDPAACDRLFPLVYEELRRLAGVLLGAEHGRAALTLQPTALVHDAYVRLTGARDLAWTDRAHFFNTAARAMRRILIDRARHHKAAGIPTVPLAGQQPTPPVAEPPVGDDLLLLDEAMQTLAARDQRQHEIVMLRYFAGLTIEQTASALNLSTATVKNDWAYARAWLLREIERRRA